MNLGTFIIGAILALIVFFPVFMSISGNRNRRSKLQKSIIAQMSKKQLKAGKISFAGNIAIGIDESQSRLYFVNLDNLEWVQELEIKELASCKKLHETRSFRTAYGMQSATVKIALQFQLNNTGSTPTYFAFYDEENGIQLNNELQLATEWEGIINELLYGSQTISLPKRNIRKRA